MKEIQFYSARNGHVRRVVVSLGKKSRLYTDFSFTWKQSLDILCFLLAIRKIKDGVSVVDLLKRRGIEVIVFEDRIQIQPFNWMRHFSSLKGILITLLEEWKEFTGYYKKIP